MTKGQFQKGNQAAKKPQTLKTSLFVVNKAASLDVIKEKKETENNTNDYIPFDTDNLFPQRCVEIFRRSPVMRSVILNKRNYVVGKGLFSEDTRYINWKPNSNEQIEDVILKLEQDKLITGNCFIEVVKNKGLLEVFHIDSTKVRIKKDGKFAMLHPDWSKYNSNKKLTKEIPLYPTFELIDGRQRSILHIKDYEPEFKWYGIPSNIAGYDSANISYKTNRWNLSRLDNSFSVSGVLNVKANFSAEDAKEFKEKLEDNHTGDGNNGKLLTIVDPIGAENGGTSFTPIATNEEGNWLDLHRQSTEEIIVSNQWYASLSGLNVASGFDTNRIRNDYEVAIKTIIPYEQRFFVEAFYTLFKEQLGWDLMDLHFVNVSPIEMSDFEQLTDTVIKLNNEVKEGRMSEEMAKNILIYSFKLSQEEIDLLWQ